MELDYKKLYEELVQRARELHEGGNALTKLQMEIVCPELAESEDERIRKELMCHIQGEIDTYDNMVSGDYDPRDKEDKKVHSMLKRAKAYLEKQKVNTEGDFARGYDCGYECCLNSNGAEWFEKQKEQKPVVYVPKFRVGDKVLSTNNPHLTYDILEVGLINELGNPDYRVEILTDEQSDTPHNIRLIECQKMDKWGKLIEQKPAEWSEDDEDIIYSICLFLIQAEQSKRYGSIQIAQIEECLNWLKFLRLKSHWKPSEEQMDALLNAEGLVRANNYPENAKILALLYEQLKTL